MDYPVEILSVCAFLFTMGVFYLLSRGLDREGRKTEARVRDLAHEHQGQKESLWESISESFSAIGRSIGELTESKHLHSRLRQAGYHQHLTKAANLFRATQVALSCTLLAAGVALPWSFGLSNGSILLGTGISCCALGFLIPGLLLDQFTKRRLAELRRGWPDALDMMVLCLEGGVSVSGALQRVCDEMELVHPTLGIEMNLFQVEMNLGRNAGEALMNMGDRNNLDEVRDLAAVFLQSEQYGVSITKAIRLHADSCRQDRHMRAEEKAQKAAVQILFPTLLCIFPAIFIVILGPAAYQIAEMFN